ncbi:MAG: hypothetical protein AB7E79_14655 [Rhodospirillaceae bacterium]
MDPGITRIVSLLIVGGFCLIGMNSCAGSSWAVSIGKSEPAGSIFNLVVNVGESARLELVGAPRSSDTP